MSRPKRRVKTPDEEQQEVAAPEPKTRRTASQIYEVERIVAHKIEKGTLRYLVKWVGYDDKENTWEPEQNLRCPRIVREYMLNIPEISTVVTEPSKE